MKRTAIFGGSFDPPQVCHVLVVTHALCTGNFDEIRVIPVYKHAFMKELTDFDLRVRMLRASLAHLGSQVIVDTIESTLPTPNYTIHTVEALLEQDENLDITWLCGADVHADRHRWKDWDKLKNLVTFEVFGREGVDMPGDANFRTILPNISSTSIRLHVASGLPVRHLVHSDAMAIIEAEGLYRT